MLFRSKIENRNTIGSKGLSSKSKKHLQGSEVGMRTLGRGFSLQNHRKREDTHREGVHIHTHSSYGRHTHSKHRQKLLHIHTHSSYGRHTHSKHRQKLLHFVLLCLTHSHTHTHSNIAKQGKQPRDTQYNMSDGEI